MVRGLREPIQRVDTTPGWLRREMDTVVWPDTVSSRQGTYRRLGCGGGALVLLRASTWTAESLMVTARLAAVSRHATDGVA